MMPNSVFLVKPVKSFVFYSVSYDADETVLTHVCQGFFEQNQVLSFGYQTWQTRKYQMLQFLLRPLEAESFLQIFDVDYYFFIHDSGGR